MKKTSFILLLLLIAAACRDNGGKVEVLPDFDSEYYQAGKVDVAAKFSDGREAFGNAAADIISAEFSETNPNSIYFFSAQLFIGAEGKVEKVRYKEKVLPKISDKIKINPGLESVYSAVTKKLSEWTFTPAMLKGKDVPSQLTWNISVKIDSAGTADNYFTEFLIPPVPPPPPKGFNSELYFRSVDEMPSVIGGIQSIQKNIVYPELAKRAGIEGRVFVKAFIDENGVPVVVELLKGIGAGCDEAAINAVKKVRFKPGTQDGKTVRTQVSIPILFKLQ